MQKKFDIITRNFFRMMRSGAMNEYVEVEPMSAFKWKKLNDIFLNQDVASVAWRAVKNFQFEPTFNMPQEERARLQAEAEKKGTSNIQLEVTNTFLNKKLQRIQSQEKRSQTYSPETLELFNIIIANCHAILYSGTSMRLIIKLGNCIRINGKKIDFQKIDKWINEMQMTKAAALTGTILLENFAFKPEELPFVKKTYPKAARAMCASITSRRKESHNSGITYFEYAPLENASILISRFKGRLDSIEE